MSSNTSNQPSNHVNTTRGISPNTTVLFDALDQLTTTKNSQSCEKEASQEAAPSTESDTLNEEAEILFVDSDGVAEIDPIKKATLQDVVISALPITPFKRYNKKNGPPHKSICSKLVSILGIAPSKLSIVFLRNFCRREHILSKVRNPQKGMCAHAIAEAKLHPPIIPSPKKKKELIKLNGVNRKRYINVLFTETINEELNYRGAVLTKEELAAGVREDEYLHRAIVKEYNNNEKHKEDAYPNLILCPGDPAVFEGPIVWMQSKQTFEDIIGKYDICLNNWKVFGGDENSLKPFSDFVKNHYTLLYFHEHAYAFPHVYEKMAGNLPEGVFYESTSGRVRPLLRWRLQKRRERRIGTNAKQQRSVPRFLLPQTQSWKLDKNISISTKTPCLRRR